jgi:hypothetical protein
MVALPALAQTQGQRAVCSEVSVVEGGRAPRCVVVECDAEGKCWCPREQPLNEQQCREIVREEEKREPAHAKSSAEPAGAKSEDVRHAAPKAPGVPTANDGFIPTKNWDGKLVPNPNGKGYGYPDEKGDVWIPTGDGPSAHGGPHWDVQTPGGKYRNVYPGGRVRK